LLEQAKALLEQNDADGARNCVEEARGLDPSCPGLDDIAKKIPAGSSPQGPTPPVDRGSGSEPSPGEAAPGPKKNGGKTDKPAADPKDAKDGKPAAPRPGEPIVVTGPDGKKKEQYAQDAQGRKNGEYVAYHDNGKPSIRAHYVA